MTTPAQYVPRLWKDAPDTSTPITASELNRMEQGIVAAETLALDAIPKTQRGVANGVAVLDADGKLLATQLSINPAAVLLTEGAQTKAGVLTFLDKPVVPVRTWPVDRIDASGRDTAALGTRFLRDDGAWEVPSGGGASANTPGTLNNPITDPNAARPTGLTFVVWKTVTDPVSWQDGDLQMIVGS